MDKESRKKRVLDIIIRSHIDTAEPVGSRMVSRRLNLSSATIRNIMSDLEEEGLISQPYTSAGRIPTDRAYRLYVDTIMRKHAIPAEEREAVKKIYLSKVKEMRDLAEYTSHVISTLTSYTGFAISPENRFCMDGAYHMLEQPEFRDVERIRILLQILEEKQKMAQLMNSYFTKGLVSVHIGAENVYDGFKLCSIITASWKMKNDAVSGLGVIGPTRMQYERVIPVIEMLSEATSRFFEEVYD